MAVSSIYSMDDHYRTVSVAEELLLEWSHDLAGIDEATLQVELSAIIRATGGATGTFRARVGGTIGLPDGTLAAQIQTTSDLFIQRKGYLTIPNPAVLTLIKLTGLVSSGAQAAEMRGAVVTVRAGVVAAGVVVAAAVRNPLPPASQADRLWGRDLYFDVTTNDGPDYVVTPAGDWMTVSGRECLRQALIREYLTNPGEWATFPEYGAGARMYVKARNRRTERDALAARLLARSLANPRVASVEDVKVEAIEGGLKFRVVVIPKGESQRNRPLTVTGELR